MSSLEGAPAADPRSAAHEPVAGATVPDRLLVPTVFAIFATAVANTTSGAIAQPAISDAFRAGAADVGWIVFGYSSAFAVMTAVYGGLARRFGLIPCLTSGVLLLALGAALAVLAVNLPMLILARILQGVGAGAVPTLSMALLARRLTGPARARALGVNVAAVGLGFAAGPLVGGLLLEAFGWRGAMALGLLVAPAAAIVWRFDRERGDRMAPVDLPGILLLAATIASLVFFVNRVPVSGLAPQVVAAALGFVVFGAVSVAYSRTRADPALPLDVLRDTRVTRLMMLGFIGQTAFLGSLVIVPVAVARVHDVGGFLLGVLLLPMAGVIALLSPQNGRVEARIGRPATTAVALTVVGGAAALMAAVGAGAGPLGLAVVLMLAGVGFSFLNAPLVNEVSALYPGPRRSVALGIYNLAFFLGSAAGAAISTAFVQAGIEAPFFAGRPLPGFSTGLLLIAAAPILAAGAAWARAARTASRSASTWR